MQWFLSIETDDPVRRTINQGFQLVILGLTVIDSFVLLRNLALGVYNIITASAAFFLLLCLLIFWLNRRGSAAGAALFALYAALITSFGFLPETYASPPVIHVLFLLPAVIAALFIVPWAGFPAALLQAALLGLALWQDGWPQATISEFVFVCGVNLSGVVLPVAVAAGLWRRTIAWQAAVNERLDAQVAERTAELRRVMDLREADITAVVHDIHNRMTIVRAEVDDLVAGLPPGMPAAEVRSAERRVNDAVGAVGSLVEDLRTAVQLDNAALRLEREPVDLEALVRRVVDRQSAAAAHAGCALALGRVARTPLVSGDERKLERVLANLVGNAVKYTRQMPAGRRSVTVHIGPAEGGAEVSVEDSGPGLDAAALAELGRPFVRLASARGTDGMGLGVYISRGIVEHHSGRLEFISPGVAGGTTALVWLPAADDVA